METFQDAVAHMKEEHPCDIQLLWLERFENLYALTKALDRVGSRWRTAESLGSVLVKRPPSTFDKAFQKSSAGSPSKSVNETNETTSAEDLKRSGSLSR